MNELIKILEYFPDKEWDWHYLTSNPNISLEYIDNHPELPWVKENICRNPNITLNYVFQHPEIVWDWQALANNSGITLNDISSHPEIPWNYLYVSHNDNITLDFILENIEHFDTKEKSKNLGKGSLITLKNIEDHPELFWSKGVLSMNPNLTLDYVFDHPDDSDNKWEWLFICSNIGITYQDVMNHSDVLKKEMFIPLFCCNPNMTLDLIEKDITFSQYIGLSVINPSVSLEMIDTIYDKVEVKNAISLNPNITLEYIIEHEEIIKFGQSGLSTNRFKCQPYFEEAIIIRV